MRYDRSDPVAHTCTSKARPRNWSRRFAAGAGTRRDRHGANEGHSPGRGSRPVADQSSTGRHASHSTFSVGDTSIAASAKPRVKPSSSGVGNTTTVLSTTPIDVLSTRSRLSSRCRVSSVVSMPRAVGRRKSVAVGSYAASSPATPMVTSTAPAAPVTPASSSCPNPISRSEPRASHRWARSPASRRMARTPARGATNNTL